MASSERRLFEPFEPGSPSLWPVGSRVVVPEAEDMHFFRRGTAGTVVRHSDRHYLGVIVQLDVPIDCDHGHYRHLITTFNFNAVDLKTESPDGK